MTESNPYSTPNTDLTVPPEGIDTTFKLNLFSPKGRLDRLRYFSLTILTFFLFSLLASTLPLLSTAVNPILVFAVLAILFLYIQGILVLKRLHDFNAPGILIPILCLPVFVSVKALLAPLGLLLFVPGTKGANDFGNQTAPQGGFSLFLIIVALIILVLALTGTLATELIPSYLNLNSYP